MSILLHSDVVRIKDIANSTNPDIQLSMVKDLCETAIHLMTATTNTSMSGFVEGKPVSIPSLSGLVARTSSRLNAKQRREIEDRIEELKTSPTQLTPEETQELAELSARLA